MPNSNPVTAPSKREADLIAKALKAIGIKSATIRSDAKSVRTTIGAGYSRTTFVFVREHTSDDSFVYKMLHKTTGLGWKNMESDPVSGEDLVSLKDFLRKSALKNILMSKTLNRVKDTDIPNF